MNIEDAVEELQNKYNNRIVNLSAFINFPEAFDKIITYLKDVHFETEWTIEKVSALIILEEINGTLMFGYKNNYHFWDKKNNRWLKEIEENYCGAV